MKARLALELLVVFGAAPIAFALAPNAALRGLFPALWVAATVMFFLLWFDPRFERRRLWNWRGAKADLRRIVLQSLAIAPIITGLVWSLDKGWLPMPGPTRGDADLLFFLPRNVPVLWAAIMILYPVLSVYVQEVFFRAWFFHRYERLFGTGTAMVVANSIAFGLGHAMFGNWIAVPLSTLGGVLFAITYVRTKSLAAVCVEHALIGNVVFTTGLGWFFFAGAQAVAERGG